MDRFNFKYVRIQGKELAKNTMYAKGVFSMCWQLIQQDVMIEEDADLLRSHLPALYGNGSMHEDNMEEWMHLYFEKLVKLNECP